MIYASVCSGIEAASVAWHPLGWRAAFVSEIDRFPCAVLAHHYPDVPNLGDMTKFKEWPDANIDVLVGGTPCQSFSVAGLRKGLDDPRGNLMFTYLAIAARYRPRWLVWENVPGVLSSNGGRDFGALLGGLAELGYGFAYRVLDAQYFGLAQRRARVFVVGCLGDWRRAAAVLFERASLRGDPAPSRETGQGFAAELAPCIGAGGRGFSRTGETRGQDPVVAMARNAHSSRYDAESETLIAHALRADGFDASEDGTWRGTPLVPVGFNARQDPDSWDDRTGPIDTDGSTQGVAFSIQAGALRENPESGPDGIGVREGIAYTVEARAEVQAVAFAQNQRDEVRTMHVAGALSKESGMKQQTYVNQSMAVRRLTPRECERLQGFPDDWTAITYRCKPAADGPRYKALGNSMAVPVMRWLGERIEMAEEVAEAQEWVREAREVSR